MAVMDEFKEERAALKNGSLKDKLSYFWDYYRWHVIGAATIIAFVGSFVYQVATNKEIAFYAVMLNASPYTLSENENYPAEYAAYAGIDLEEYNIFFDTAIHIAENGADEISAASTQKLVVYTAAGDLDVMITSSDSFTKYANSSTFYDLREILNEEQLAKCEPYFYYVDQKIINELEAANDAWDYTYVPEYGDPSKPEEMADPIPVGIRVDGSAKLLENYYFRGDEIVLGVYSNTQHLDAALKCIDFIMQDIE